MFSIVHLASKGPTCQSLVVNTVNNGVDGITTDGRDRSHYTFHPNSHNSYGICGADCEILNTFLIAQKVYKLLKKQNILI